MTKSCQLFLQTAKQAKYLKQFNTLRSSTMLSMHEGEGTYTTTGKIIIKAEEKPQTETISLLTYAKAAAVVAGSTAAYFAAKSTGWLSGAWCGVARKKRLLLPQ
jgi:hypothetical protein